MMNYLIIIFAAAFLTALGSRLAKKLLPSKKGTNQIDQVITDESWTSDSPDGTHTTGQRRIKHTTARITDRKALKGIVSQSVERITPVEVPARLKPPD